MPDDIVPKDERPEDSTPEPDPSGDLPPGIAEVLRQLTGGAELPPEVLDQFKAMGLGDVPPEQFQQVMSAVQALVVRACNFSPRTPQTTSMAASSW